MKSIHSAIAFLIGLLFPVLGFGDGGTLTAKTLEPSDESTDWVFESCRYNVDLIPAQIELERGETISGYKLDLPRNMTLSLVLFLSNTQPSWLYSDLDGDGLFGKYQAKEGFQEETPGRETKNTGHRFRNVRIPLSFTPTPLLIEVDILTGQDPKTYIDYVQIGACKSVYDGTIAVGQQQYPARAVYRSFASIENHPLFVILLDTNRDGVFHPIDDTWFSGNSYAYVDGKIWKTKIALETVSVQVELEPYTGGVGTLQLQGDGIAQIGIAKPNQGTITEPAGTPMPDTEFSLPYREDLTYRLPTEEFVISSIWLRPKVQNEIVYQWPIYRESRIEYPLIRIANDRTVQAHVGGPLEDKLRVVPINQFGQLSLEFLGSMNSNRYAFIEKNYDDFLHANEFKSQLWTMKDERGNVVLAGQFAADLLETIQFPFFSRGTYQVQRLGSDNELIRRKAITFDYHSQRPVALGIGLVVFLALVIYFYSIDREYSSARWWALVPGVAGFIEMYFVWGSPYSDFALIGAFPISLTFMLVACRICLPKKISKVFILSLAASTVGLVPLSFFFPNSEGALISLIFISVLYAILYTVFYQIVRGKPSPKRYFVVFVVETLIPPVAFASYFFAIERDVESLVALVSIFLILCAFTVPMYGLIAFNPWVRDLVVHRMMERDEEKPEEYERLKPVA